MGRFVLRTLLRLKRAPKPLESSCNVVSVIVFMNFTDGQYSLNQQQTAVRRWMLVAEQRQLFDDQSVSDGRACVRWYSKDTFPFFL